MIEESGHIVNTLRDGDFFGEIALLLLTPRNATVLAKTACDLLVLDKADFDRILHDHPWLAEGLATVARDRYSMDLCAESLIAYHECLNRLGSSPIGQQTLIPVK